MFADIPCSFEVIGACTDLTAEERNELLDLIILIARKMASVWRHLRAYHEEEKRLIEKFSARTDPHREHSEKLFEEFDVFAVQIKSTLDHLVKVMRPMLGRKWTMYTFADKGEGVLNSLKRNTSKHYAGRVRSIEHLLFLFDDRHKKWPPPPTCLHELSRFSRIPEDVSGDDKRRQAPPSQRISTSRRRVGARMPATAGSETIGASVPS